MIIPLSLTEVLGVDSTSVESTDAMLGNLTNPLKANPSELAQVGSEWLTGLLNFGIRVVIAIALFLVGRYLIRHLTGSIRRLVLRKTVDGVGSTLLDSIIVAILYILLGIGIAAVLGVQSVSFAAILASMGLAVGMALSGQLQNLAGGVIIMFTKPFNIGDFIDAQTVSGVVQEVNLFHTHISTPDNKSIFIPNGVLSSGVVTNLSGVSTRRVDWTFSVEYGQDFEAAKDLLIKLMKQEARIVNDPMEPFVAILKLNSSSVDLTARAWVKSEDYWDVFFDLNKTVYAEFNKAGIHFPFPQITVHQAKS